MNCLSQISSRLEAFFRSSSSQFRAQTSLYGAYACSWTRTISYSPPRIVAPNQNSALTRFGVRLYSAKVGKSGGSVSRSRRKSEPEPAMEKQKQPKEAFYVVRKGDVVGVYRSLNDCQAQVGSSVRCLIECQMWEFICLKIWNDGCVRACFWWILIYVSFCFFVSLDMWSSR